MMGYCMGISKTEMSESFYKEKDVFPKIQYFDFARLFIHAVSVAPKHIMSSVQEDFS